MPGKSTLLSIQLWNRGRLAAELPDTTYAVLGLIDKVPGASGYELVAVAGRSFAHFWPISQTLLYRELDRLTGLGWVAATRVEQLHAPSKWTYHTTAAGREALAGWLATPTPATSSFRSGVLLRFFFSYRMDPDQVRSLLAEYRKAVEAQQEEFVAIMDKLAAVPTSTARAGRLTALHGLRTAEARLRWVDEVEAQLGEHDA
jgi:PadR family transcriptional regulator, regulatory protein AphA